MAAQPNQPCSIHGACGSLRSRKAQPRWPSITGQSVLAYATDSTSAADYRALAEEIER